MIIDRCQQLFSMCVRGKWVALFFSVAVLLPQLLTPIDLLRVNEINFLNAALCAGVGRFARCVRDFGGVCHYVKGIPLNTPNLPAISEIQEQHRKTYLDLAEATMLNQNRTQLR